MNYCYKTLMNLMSYFTISACFLEVNKNKSVCNKNNNSNDRNNDFYLLFENTY